MINIARPTIAPPIIFMTPNNTFNTASGFLEITSNKALIAATAYDITVTIPLSIGLVAMIFNISCLIRFNTLGINFKSTMMSLTFVTLSITLAKPLIKFLFPFSRFSKKLLTPGI